MIRVMIADDSSFMRKSLMHILGSDPDIEVVDTASDGKEAVRKVIELHPDVVLLDIMMPVMDGLTALSHIMEKCPTPVLVLSGAGKQDSAIAVKSMEFGAVDFIPKPSGMISYDIETLQAELIEKVKAAAQVNVKKLYFRKQIDLHELMIGKSVKKKLVIIGASTGGPRAVAKILSELPCNMPTAIIVVMHMRPEFVESFVKKVKWDSSLDISIAGNDQIISPGRVMIVPGGRHTVIVKNGKTKKIGFHWKAALHVPSIDYAMESAAAAYGDETLGVLLTGVGDDGAKGMKAIKDAGGRTIAEDESSCIVYGMPKAAVETGCVDEIVELPEMARAILRNI